MKNIPFFSISILFSFFFVFTSNHNQFQDFSNYGINGSENKAGTVIYSGEDYNIWVYSIATNDNHKITNDAEKENIIYFNPEFSPDGTKAAFCRQHSKGSSILREIYIYEMAGEKVIKKIENACVGFNFSWSNDSKFFIYIEESTGESFSNSVVSYEIESDKMTILSNIENCTYYNSPKLSSDQSILVYDSGLDFKGCFRKGRITVFSTIDGEYYQNFKGEIDFGNSFDLLKDNRIIFDEVTGTHILDGSGIYIATFNGLETRKIFSSPQKGALNPLGSPDGNLVAFYLLSITNPGKGELGIISINGQDSTILADMWPIKWSLDGNRLLVRSDSGLGILDVSSKEVNYLPKSITTDADWYSEK